MNTVQIKINMTEYSYNKYIVSGCSSSMEWRLQGLMKVAEFAHK